MSNYQEGDIVEFFNGENIREFGLIISVHVSDTVSALVVSWFTPNNPQWISTDRVKNHWKNLKGCVTTCDILKAENERLKEALTQIGIAMLYSEDEKADEIFKLCEEKVGDSLKKAYVEKLQEDIEKMGLNHDTGKGGEDE